MTAELTAYHAPSALGEQMDFARAVSSGAMLPDAYRGKPADILLAVGLGQAMGLSPAESLYRIAVIKGKPTASAELIAANVRKAGHRLRVTGDATSSTASIWRADDPDFEFAVTRDLDWARGMGLASNDNYKKQAGTMLQWRAITACARLACPEALYGVVYTPDEMDDGRPATSSSTGRERLREALRPAEDIGDILAPEPDPVDVTTAEEVPDAPLLSAAQLTKVNILIREQGITDRPAALTFVGQIVGRVVESTKTLTKAEAHTVIETLTETPTPPADDESWGSAGGAA
jgi:hypothetical protein